jgi:O-antigen/teichoic acid export membrane protein
LKGEGSLAAGRLHRITTQPKNERAYVESRHEREGDLTGRDRLVWNVIFNWGGHFVFIVTGFIVPRMIDRRLGQELLGVWDFAWSLVTCFELVRAGISSSVQSYVATYRTAGDVARMNLIVSSASFVLCVAGLAVLGLTTVVSLLLPQLFGNRLGENVREAQWVVLFLGATLGTEVAFGAFAGVLSGCHRWGLHNVNISGWYAATTAGMFVALLLGGRLCALAAITFTGELLADLTSVMLAHRVCEGLRLRLSLVRSLTVRELFVFGGKTLIPNVSSLLLHQSTSILIVYYLGPAALALYSRPGGLVRHAYALVNKYASVLTPIISSLKSREDLEGIRELLTKSVQHSLYMALPMVLVLALFGGAIMQLWMGSHYANGLIPAILAFGYLATMGQVPALKVLQGLNAHGRAGMAQLAASLCSVGLTVLALAFLKWGLAGAAVAVTLPLTIVNTTYLPLVVCRRVGLSAGTYFLSAVLEPVLHMFPFALCLVGMRLIFHSQPLVCMAFSVAVGGVVLAVTYWKCALPDGIKTRFSCAWAAKLQTLRRRKVRHEEA